MKLRKNSFVLGVCCLLAGGAASAAEQNPAPAAVPVPAPAPAAPASAAPAAPARLLRQIVIADTAEELTALTSQPSTGFVVLSPNLSALKHADFVKLLGPGENQAIDQTLLAAIKQVVENYSRNSEFPNATVDFPSQTIAEGIVRVLLQLGARVKGTAITGATELKIRKISMPETRWFSDSLLREKLRIEPGRVIRLSELDQAISWTNNNPYRRVKIHLEPIPNTGEADVTVAVQEAMPLRLMASVDNGGSELIGRNRYVASVSYANLWGKDHQVGYQYITTNEGQYFQAHGMDYRMPLPWRHFVQLSGSYLLSKPEFYDGLFVQNGETVTTDLRYTAPLRAGDTTVELYGLLSFKQSNNNLMWDPHFNNVQVLGTKTDIFQLTLGGSIVRRDKRGAWAMGGGLTFSPGGINSRNTDRAFDAGRYGGTDSARIGAKARYAFINLSAQRLLTIAPGWDFVSRAVVQLSEANLLPSEQLGIGGNATVRGFNESTFAGDHGFVFSNELMAPPLKTPLPYLSKKRGPLETRFLAFVDTGNTTVRRAYPTDFPRKGLASAGVGVRMNLAVNFSLAADYGWHLSKLPYSVEEHGRGHIKATLAY